METVTSADGTSIAFERTGSGLVRSGAPLGRALNHTLPLAPSINESSSPSFAGLCLVTMDCKES